MIPAVDAARLALAPYLLWIKLSSWLLVFALIFGAGWKAGASLTQLRWQRAAEKQAADYRFSLALAREAERASYAKRDEVSNALQKDLAATRAERDRLRALPARTVRVYVPAASATSLPAVAGTTAGRPGATAGTAAPAATLGPDIGRSLYAIVDDGDEREAELRARLTACRDGWVGVANAVPDSVRR
jgi:hypothetical protein